MCIRDSIHSYGTTFRIRHQSTRTEYTTERTNLTHDRRHSDGVQKGALASVSVSNTQLGEKAADMADKILKGTPVYGNLFGCCRLYYLLHGSLYGGIYGSLFCPKQAMLLTRNNKTSNCFILVLF